MNGGPLLNLLSVREDEHTRHQPSGQTIRYPEGTSWRVGVGMSVVVAFPASK